MTPKIINDLVINVATVNGSGSQSANQILIKALFKMGIPVGGKNLFPSNIAGLPTWFIIRANEKGYVGSRNEPDLVVAMNAQTILDDIKKTRSKGLFVYNSDLKFDTSLLRDDVQNLGIPFRELVTPLSDSIKMKKLLTNMVYVGLLGELLNIDKTALSQAIESQFKGKDKAIEVNQKALEAGSKFITDHPEMKEACLYAVAKDNKNTDKILVDGNTAAALGSIYGGCTFVSWYPITPSSSVVENFMTYAEKLRKNKQDEKTYAVVQAEDELAAICMVTGAGWAGARAMTATSGPGFSLMAECVGFSYFTEIPTVVWNIQRVGPSTGLPTRTMQGDINSAYTLSHGDTKHVVLLPATPAECFEFGQTSFDLAERLQTFVAVLSDLDLGMNLWMSDEFEYNENKYDRGKVLSATDLEKMKTFNRYQDVDGDGIPYRTLPGTENEKAAYFTRGSGHDESAAYTEDHVEFQKLMDRLNKKFETARTLVPKPAIDLNGGAKTGLVAFGSTDAIMPEARNLLKEKNLATNYLRLRALPLTQEVKDFIKAQDQIFVVEQNRDAQLKDIIVSEMPECANKIRSVLHYDGLPIDAQFVVEKIISQEVQA